MEKYLLTALVLIAIGFTQIISAQEPEKSDAAELAKKLSNPIASLISLPFQNNTDIGIGANNGSKNTLNIQPVVPIGISSNLNLITRLVLPVVSQYNITGVGEDQFGLSDGVLSAFLSPSNAKGGLTWGAGPVFLLPIGTDKYLTGKKFGIGPTAVALYQTNGFTVGALINQIWSVAGDENRSDINMLFFQPFLSYNWKTGAGLGANFEITQNWEASITNIWLNPTFTAVTSFGKQKAQFLVGPRFNLAAPDGGKAAFGVRAGLVLLFPK